MKGRIEEAEVIIRLDAQSKTAYVTVFSWPKWARKMQKLYGESKDKRNTNQAMRWEIPVRAVSMRRKSESKMPHRIPAFVPRHRKNTQSEDLQTELGL